MGSCRVQDSRGAEGTWNMSRSFGFERARNVLPQQAGRISGLPFLSHSGLLF